MRRLTRSLIVISLYWQSSFRHWEESTWISSLWIDDLSRYGKRSLWSPLRHPSHGRDRNNLFCAGWEHHISFLWQGRLTISFAILGGSKLVGFYSEVVLFLFLFFFDFFWKSNLFNLNNNFINSLNLVWWHSSLLLNKIILTCEKIRTILSLKC